MFVLQDCSICFEDYNLQRTPHNISCGHVFCRTCLDSLIVSSPNCPHCRVAFDCSAIRKVICTYQDPPPSFGVPSDAESIMRQSIINTAESTNDHEQRGIFVRDLSRMSLLGAESLEDPLEVMRSLAEAENTNRALAYEIDTARAVETSLRDRIYFLESRPEQNRYLPAPATYASTEYDPTNDEPVEHEDPEDYEDSVDHEDPADHEDPVDYDHPLEDDDPTDYDPPDLHEVGDFDDPADFDDPTDYNDPTDDVDPLEFDVNDPPDLDEIAGLHAIEDYDDPVEYDFDPPDLGDMGDLDDIHDIGDYNDVADYYDPEDYY